MMNNKYDYICFSSEAPKVSLDSLFGANEIRVKAGEPLDIALIVSGTPTPTVSWEKNGRPVDNRVIFIL